VLKVACVTAGFNISVRATPDAISFELHNPKIVGMPQRYVKTSYTNQNETQESLEP
jgi:hypothetical protein